MKRTYRFQRLIGPLLAGIAALIPSSAGLAQMTPLSPAVEADAAGCLPPDQIEDRDGDFRRNATALNSSKLCIKQEIFQEGGLRWVLQIIENRKSPKKALWVVPHDNEDVAFNTAVHGVLTHGGTMIAVETGGRRFNGPQDPNRNFDADTGIRCPQQVARSPEYTRRIMSRAAPGAPIIALHSNDRGYSGDGRGGTGAISIANPNGAIPFRSPSPLGGLSPNDTLVFVASRAQPKSDPTLARFVEQLNQRGVHVLYEVVSSTRNDCSMSNYAALQKIPNYVNVEVVHHDGETQRRIVSIVMGLLSDRAVAAVRERPTPTPGAAMTEAGPGENPEDAAPVQGFPLWRFFTGSTPQASPPSTPQVSPSGMPQASPPSMPATSQLRGPPSRFIWIAARSEDDAAQISRQVRESFPGLLDGREVIIRAAKQPDMSVHYRALLGPFASHKQARSVCQKLRQAGESCTVESSTSKH
jgi:sporulation related protein